MNIEATPSGSHVVLRVSGRMDASNAQEFEVACTPWAQQGFKHLVVDISQLEYVSSMGLRYFVNVGKLLTDQGGALHLCGIQGFVKQLFRITRLTNVFPMHETVEDAIAGL